MIFMGCVSHFKHNDIFIIIIIIIIMHLVSFVRSTFNN